MDPMITTLKGIMNIMNTTAGITVMMIMERIAMIVTTTKGIITDITR